MKQRLLGGLAVSEIGFGMMSFASTYGQSPDRAEAIRVIRGAHDLGVTFFDTAEAYGPLTNEVQLAAQHGTPKPRQQGGDRVGRATVRLIAIPKRCRSARGGHRRAARLVACWAGRLDHAPLEVGQAYRFMPMPSQKGVGLNGP